MHAVLHILKLQPHFTTLQLQYTHHIAQIVPLRHHSHIITWHNTVATEQHIYMLHIHTTLYTSIYSHAQYMHSRIRRHTCQLPGISFSSEHNVQLCEPMVLVMVLPIHSWTRSVFYFVDTLIQHYTDSGFSMEKIYALFAELCYYYFCSPTLQHEGAGSSDGKIDSIWDFYAREDGMSYIIFAHEVRPEIAQYHIRKPSYQKILAIIIQVMLTIARTIIWIFLIVMVLVKSHQLTFDNM